MAQDYKQTNEAVGDFSLPDSKPNDSLQGTAGVNNGARFVGACQGRDGLDNSDLRMLLELATREANQKE